ncbi:MAG TPA: hydantoinase/oxoprolinase family protein [bacterium]|nr:hydantoinase/oxoprolinase family protein [bacterium]
MGQYRLGIDIGGTFTDFSLMDDTGAVVSLKTPSVPADPAGAVWNGLQKLVETTSVDPREIAYLVHGTTLGVNTLIERTGARTALLVTRGFRDVLIIARQRVPNPNDYMTAKPAPLVPRHWVVEIDERTAASGREVRPLDTAAVEAAGRRLVDEGVEAVAIAFLHAHRNPSHEAAAAECLRRNFPGLYVCASHEVWPEQREYERTSMTVINAYLGIRLRQYFTNLRARMETLSPRTTLLTTKSNGGAMSVESAYHSPVETLLSGPASGVMGALQIARQAGWSKVVALDMGGTSADVSVIDGDIAYGTENAVGDFPVIIPAIDVSSIGAGGGSIAWCDSAGVLKVGPMSAGADPGPACYGRGGRRPTVTDAYVTLGIIDPAQFLGGTMPLRRDLAVASVATLGATLEMEPEAAAESILQVATSNMYAQFMPLMTRRGVDPQDFALLAYGGAGATHAFLIAREVGITRVLVPPSPGTLCALGSLLADLRRDFVRTIYAPLGAASAQLADQFAGLKGAATAWVTGEGVALSRIDYAYATDLRYKGQSFELTVAVPDDVFGPNGGDALADRFHRLHEDVYGHADPATPVELINARLTVIGVPAKPALRGAAEGRPPAAARARETRPIFFEGARVPAAVYARAALRPGDTLDGPAIVEQYDTTTFVPPGFVVRVDPWENLIGEAR